MPEGPEVRRAADALRRALEGQVAVRVAIARPALARPGAALSGERIIAVEPRSKAMLIYFGNGRTLYSHNQLYGRWVVARADASPPAGNRVLRVAIETHQHRAALYSATDIALLDAEGLARHPYLARLGVEVLDPRTTAGDLLARAGEPRDARRSLAALLLDQGFYAGLGNYLRSEILFIARLRHDRRLGELDGDERRLLAHTTLQVTRQAYRQRGVTNDLGRVRELKAAGLSYAAYRHRVFDRAGEPCWDCATPIVRVDVAGRGIYYCPRCQGYPEGADAGAVTVARQRGRGRSYR